MSQADVERGENRGKAKREKQTQKTQISSSFEGKRKKKKIIRKKGKENNNQTFVKRERK